MSTTAKPEQAATQHKAKRSAALFSVLAAFGVTLLKLLTGLLTGSLGMLSEAAHSGIDLIAAGITLFSVHVSDRPADADHTYGHGKIESLSAAIESVLMLASCVWILTEAIDRIVHRQHLALIERKRHVAAAELPAVIFGQAVGDEERGVRIGHAAVSAPRRFSQVN